MPFVSLTRLRLRSAIYLLPFFIHTVRSSRQIVRAPQFFKGKVLLDRHLTFWTLTLWNSEAGMRAYRGSGDHKKAMPKLQHWCDEASVAHWQQEDDTLPSWSDAYEHMKSGRVSKVRHPSPDHAALRIPPPRYPSRTERILLPKQ